jgi:OOP family OmpA-OmpF porin
MCRFLIAFFVSLVLSAPAYAGEHGFESTSEGMIEALTKPGSKEAVPTRGWTPLAQPPRAIKVVKKEQGKTVEEWKSINETSPTQSVNLKIEFDVNSYAIRPDSFKLLNELGKALASDRLREKTVAIKGHTDSDGSEAHNLTLSVNRAQAVKEYLVANAGIKADRIEVAGYGEALPLVPNTSADNKQVNRRVEVEAVP